MRAGGRIEAAALALAVASFVSVMTSACARQLSDGELRSTYGGDRNTAPTTDAAAGASAATPASGDGGADGGASAGMFPTPYTAAQIRDATKAGRTYRFRVANAGSPPGDRVMTFTKVDAEGAELVTNGQAPERVTWEELRRHAEFPAPVVSTRQEKVTVPAGTFDCTVYVVLGEPGVTRTFYFAKNLPGAPVLFFTEKDGKRVMTSTLIDHRGGP
jgi:hypothetical protein